MTWGFILRGTLCPVWGGSLIWFAQVYMGVDVACNDPIGVPTPPYIVRGVRVTRSDRFTYIFPSLVTCWKVWETIQRPLPFFSDSRHDLGDWPVPLVTWRWMLHRRTTTPTSRSHPYFTNGRWTLPKARSVIQLLCCIHVTSLDLPTMLISI